METTDSLLTHPTPLKKNHTHNATPTPTKVRESAASPLATPHTPSAGEGCSPPPPPASRRSPGDARRGAAFRSAPPAGSGGSGPAARRSPHGRGGGAAERRRATRERSATPGRPALSAPLPALPGAARHYLAAGGRFARLRTWARDVIPTTRPAGRPPARGDAAEQTPRPRRPAGQSGPSAGGAGPGRAEPGPPRGHPGGARRQGAPAALPGAHPAAPRPRSGAAVSETPPRCHAKSVQRGQKRCLDVTHVEQFYRLIPNAASTAEVLCHKKHRKARSACRQGRRALCEDVSKMSYSAGIPQAL